MLNASSFLFIGPPAVGKSTLVQRIPEILPDAYTFDLEILPDEERLPKAERLLDEYRDKLLFVGGANTGWHLRFSDYRLVFLFPQNRDAYLRRAAVRDKQNPAMAGQDITGIYKKMSARPPGTYHHLIDPIDGIPDGDEIAFAEHVLRVLDVK